MTAPLSAREVAEEIGFAVYDEDGLEPAGVSLVEAIITRDRAENAARDPGRVTQCSSVGPDWNEVGRIRRGRRCLLFSGHAGKHTDRHCDARGLPWVPPPPFAPPHLCDQWDNTGTASAEIAARGNGKRAAAIEAAALAMLIRYRELVAETSWPAWAIDLRDALNMPPESEGA